MEASVKNGHCAWADSSFFADFTPENRSLLESLAEVATAPAGTELFALGDVADAIYVLQQGVVTLTLPVTLRGSKHQVSIDSMRAGDLVGWSGLVAPYRRTLGARAATDVELARFARTALEELFAEHASVHLAIKEKLCTVIARRLALMETVLLHDLENWGSQIG